MKKMRWIALVALTLSAVMALSSCALFGGKGDVAKMLDKDAEFESDALVLTSMKKVDALAGMNYQTYRGDLAYFTDSVESGDTYVTKHVVYNLVTDAVIFEMTESETSEISVTLKTKYADMGDIIYSYVVVATTTRDADGNTPLTRTALYDALGNEVANAAGNASVNSMADFLYFNGKAYRFAEDGKLAEAFEFAVLGEMPEIVDYNEDYYLAAEDTRVVVYDKALTYVSSYDFPAYAEVISAALLANGKIMMQYEYELPEDAKKYDYVRETTTRIDGVSDYEIDRLGKFELVTLLINAKNGKAKEIKCEYAIGMITGAQHTDIAEYYAIDFDKVAALGGGYKIEDKRLSDSVEYILTIDKNGNVTPMLYEGDRVEMLTMVAPDRFAIETEERTYLVDGKGKLIGEVTNGELFGEFYYCDGKVFDMNLAQVYDLNEKNYTLVRCMENALLLSNKDGDTLLYTGKGEPAVIAKAEDDEALADYSASFAIVRVDGEYEVYAQDGNKIATLNDVTTIADVVTADNAILFRASEDGESVYYRASK